MKMSSPSISFCRNCQYYSPEGRRGGYCRKLNVSVKSCWNACNLAISPFAQNWQKFESVTEWQKKLIQQEDLFVNSVSTVVEAELFEQIPETVAVAG